MKLETFRTRSGEIAVKGGDFKVVVQEDGSVILHFHDQVRHVDWIPNKREKETAKLEETLSA